MEPLYEPTATPPTDVQKLLGEQVARVLNEFIKDWALSKHKHATRWQACLFTRALQVEGLYLGPVKELYDQQLQQEEILRLKGICLAAAAEIEMHIDAHLDQEGYGPQSLLNNLKGLSKGSYPSHEAKVEENEGTSL